MIALFNTEAKSITCLEMIHAYLIANREGYNAEKWSDVNKSDSAELWAVSLPPCPVEVIGAIDFVEQYPEGWRIETERIQ